MKKVISILVFILALVFLMNTVLASSRNSGEVLNTNYNKPDNDVALATPKKINSDNLTVIKVFNNEAQPQKEKIGEKEITIKTKATVSPKKTVKIDSKSKTRASTPYTSRYGTTRHWDATTLRYLSHLYNFDYSTYIRSKMIKKIEKYARDNHISTITMATLNASTY